MSIAWKTLVEVRERRRQLALAAMLVEQRAVEQSRAGMQLAQAERQRYIDAKSAHWEGIHDAMSQGTGNIAQLANAAAWSGVLDTRISQHNALVLQAQMATRACEARLASSSQFLRQAAAGLMKAEQMWERQRVQQRRATEAGADSAIEELAPITWAARQMRRAGE